MRIFKAEIGFKPYSLQSISLCTGCVVHAPHEIVHAPHEQLLYLAQRLARPAPQDLKEGLQKLKTHSLGNGRRRAGLREAQGQSVPQRCVQA